MGFDIEPNSKTVLGDLEYDIWIPNKRIAIEYNGVYWHSSMRKDEKYHVTKFIRSRDANVKLIQIFEDEWERKPEIVKARLASVLGVGTRIYARKCVISEISGKEYRQFIDMHHLQGYASATYKYGLHYDNQLVAVMSFSKSRYTSDDYELIRYCSIGNVIGGASKLFKQFIAKHQPNKIVSFANRCWSNGELYRILGFVDITKNDYNTGFWFVKNQKRYHRSTFTKSNLVAAGYNPITTADEIMKSAGYLKIYNCGNYKFEWANQEK